MYLNKTNLLVTGARYLNKLNLLGSGPEPVVNYVAKTDGFSQYWQTSGFINMQAGDEMTTSVRIDSFSTSSYVFDDGRFETGTRPYLLVGRNTRQITNISGYYDLYIDGVFIDLSTNKFWPNDNDYHDVRIVALQSMDVTRFCARFFGPSDYLEGVVKDIYFTRASGNLSLPLTDREQGATQSPIEGSISLTMANYTPDVWEVDNDANN